MAGDSSLMSKVADKNGRVEESAAEDRIILGENPAEKLQTAEFSSDSSISLTSKSHNSLCGDNGGKSLGVLETRVNKLQISSRFGPLAAVNEEETAVENCVLQENSADCVEEATLTEDISLIRKDEEGISNSTESQVAILQNSEEIRAKSPMVCSEIDLEKRVWQNSAADSDEEATLREDFSQLVHDGSEIPSGTERQGVILQDAEKIKAKAPVVCPENSLEDGDLLKLCLKMTIRGSLKLWTKSLPTRRTGSCSSSKEAEDLQTTIFVSGSTSISPYFVRDQPLKLYPPSKMMNVRINWAGYLYNRFLKENIVKNLN